MKVIESELDWDCSDGECDALALSGELDSLMGEPVCRTCLECGVTFWYPGRELVCGLCRYLSGVAA